MKKKFNVLKLKEELLSNLAELKFDFMTSIQENSLPLVLEGKDVIAQAKTGSGKTAAFGLGILNSLDPSKNHIHAIILCPTRELAEQVASDLRTLGRKLANIKIITLCGGSSEEQQDKSLEKGAHIVVGTPGRVLSHLRKASLKLESLKVFTLDEADRMLDMGFHEDIIELVDYLPKKRQSLLFSATYPENIKQLSDEIQNNAVDIKVDIAHEENKITQIFYEYLEGQDKNNFLYKILSQFRPERAIVFCRTKKETNDVAEFLINRKIYAHSLNGDLDQNQRTEVFTKFSNRSLSVLVATDIAARGLDIEDLEAIINYKMPSSAEDYVHRVGRTGRAGKKGLAFSFFDSFEKSKLEEIEKLTNKSCDIRHTEDLSYTKKYNLIPPMRTMYINGGRKQKIRRGDVLGALIGEAELKADDVGMISVFAEQTYVAIKSNRIEQAIEKLGNGKIKKRKYKVGWA